MCVYIQPSRQPSCKILFWGLELPERNATCPNPLPLPTPPPSPALLLCRLLGCPEGRSAERWVDFNFFGHQVGFEGRRTLSTRVCWVLVLLWL
jgi:hypothetical protein